MIANSYPALMPSYNPLDVTFERGEGMYLYDENGKDYLDFAGGIAVVSLGHCHPHLVSILQKQAETLWHTSNVYKIAHQERMAERLVEASFADNVFFTNSGVEAIECAIKTARRFQYAEGHPERYRIITFNNAFHGRSLATISAVGREKLTKGFGPMVEGFDQVPFLDIDATRAAITPETAAIMVEVVQGEGGIVAANPEQLQQLRQLADEHGLLLIMDEIQCGMGRTGKLFAFEWSGIVPDIVASAKGIGNGFPLGACLTTGEVGKHMTPGSHGSTYGGNPLATAVGNGVLDIMLEEGFMDNVTEQSQYLRSKLDELQAKFPNTIKEIRGMGLMIGIELDQEVRPILIALLEDGFLCAAAGLKVLRLLPPLTLSKADIDKAVGHIEKAISGVKAG